MLKLAASSSQKPADVAIALRARTLRLMVQSKMTCIHKVLGDTICIEYADKYFSPIA